MQTNLPSHPQFAKAIGLACLIAGTLDLADALIFYGLRGSSTHHASFEGIAGGAAVVPPSPEVLVLPCSAWCCHFFIATTVATTVYFLASRRLPLHRRPLLWGGLYGIVVYIVMNYVVIPLSRIGPRPTPPLVPLINGVAALVFCIGIPIALIARRYIPYKSS